MTDEFQSADKDRSASPQKRSGRVGRILDAVARWAIGLLTAAACYFIFSKYLLLNDEGIDGESAVEIVASVPLELPTATTEDEDNETASDANETAEPELPAEGVAKPLRLSDSISMELIASAAHPMDPLVELAERGLEILDSKYRDYRAKMVTQVRTGKTLHEENVMQLKLRHARTESEGGPPSTVPFSIYTRFVKPKSKVGQEAIWVEGRDEGKILGHGTGVLNIKIAYLDPTGVFAMKGNRYPIYEIGFRNLVKKMKQFGENDRQHDECEVKIDRNVLVDERPCTRITVTHPVKRDHFEYHIAKIYIDDEYEIPTGYEGYLWPETEGGDPVLLERYFYIDLELNCELEDIDFDINNPDYDYPAW